jgi:hypothetical protein
MKLGEKMKNFLFGLIYLILMSIVLFAIDFNLFQSGFNGFMYDNYAIEAKVLSMQIYSFAKSSKSENPYNLRTMEVSNIEDKPLAAGGINPNCYPSIPTTFFGSSHQQAAKYEEFFNRLPCPINGEIKIYSAIAVQKPKALWHFYFMQTAPHTFIEIDEAGKPLLPYSKLGWITAIAVFLILVFLNRRFVRSKRWSFVKYPNYFLALIFATILQAGISHWPNWSFN